MVPPRRVDDEDDDEDNDAAVEGGGGGAALEESNEDEENNENTDDELFMETIRRGAIAVQQRRRRLLERANRQHHAEDDEDTTNSDVLVIQRPLQRNVLPTSAPSDSLLLLYCGPSPSSSHQPHQQLPKGFYRLDTANQDNSGNDAGCGRLICARGRIMSSMSKHAEIYESDAPPSQELLDWLSIIPSKDDQLNWPHLCDCVQASLGCRNW